jgi:hypothetical protein
MNPLPAGFEMLEPFVHGWAVEGAANRALRRGASTDVERTAYFAAVQPLLDAALEILDAKPPREHNEAERNLMNLCLALAHVAPAIEAQGDDEDKHKLNRDKMQITRAPSDF